jgi:hypothetical protein
VVLDNDGAPAFNATLFDTVTDADNNIIFSQSWDLGTVPHGEEDTVSYSVFFHSDIPPGVYTNHAFVKSRSRSADPKGGIESDSPIATAEVTILGDEPPQVSDALPPACDQYLKSSIKAGQQNDPTEVSKLQDFLSTFGGFSDVKDTGVYDQATQNAVRLFQDQHKDDVLNPWGLSGPTGYVYITTRNEVNNIYCQGQKTFALSQADNQEISAYRGYLNSLRNAKSHGVAPASANTFSGNAGSDSNVDQSGASVPTGTTGPDVIERVITSAKESATNTSAAVVNATQALGGMVATTAAALSGVTGWFQSIIAHFHHH